MDKAGVVRQAQLNTPTVLWIPANESLSITDFNYTFDIIKTSFFLPLLAHATHSQQSATGTQDGVVTSSSITAGCETDDSFICPATNRTNTISPRHSSIPYLETSECPSSGPPSFRVPIASTKAILRRGKCGGQSQQLFSTHRNDARHVCCAGTILQSTVCEHFEVEIENTIG